MWDWDTPRFLWLWGVGGGVGDREGVPVASVYKWIEYFKIWFSRCFNLIKVSIYTITTEAVYQIHNYSIKEAGKPSVYIIHTHTPFKWYTFAWLSSFLRYST